MLPVQKERGSGLRSATSGSAGLSTSCVDLLPTDSDTRDRGLSDAHCASHDDSDLAIAEPSGFGRYAFAFGKKTSEKSPTRYWT